MANNIKVSYYILMASKIKNNILVLLLVLIASFLFIANYTPGTFLSGWDTLHPEFNLGFNLQREFSGVFRENQGLGAVAAHSDMADLPHIIFLYVLHFFLPMEFLRYAFFFTMLIAGPIGMYLFLEKAVIKNKIASFLGALFYLLNLGTMQQFVVPFEMFATQYAALPWIFLFATQYIHHENKGRSLILFALVTLLASPTAFAATLWYFQFFVFVLYLLTLTFSQILKKNLAIVKKVFVIIALTLFINSFWILPNIYFITTHGASAQNAQVNKLFSKEAFLYNKEFGNIKDLSLLKNFLFDWNAYSDNNQFVQLLDPWIEHLKKPFVEQIGFLFALMSFAGFIYGIKKKNKILIAFLGPLFFSLFFLINDNPPTAFLYNALRNGTPLFAEAFRFPQNKVLGIFTFVMAIYFAVFQLMLMRLFESRLYRNLIIKSIYILIVVASMSYFILPAFKGNFISPYMRINIPQEYFSLFDWFKDQNPDARIANLPIYSQWGWEYYNWYEDKKPSFQGAGFSWFGIEQPLLNRDFDRWNPANEQYYREMSHAVYSRNSAELTGVLKKYDISYILLDKNIIAPEQGGNQNVLFFDEIETLLQGNPIIQKVANFGNLFVYETSFGNQHVRLIKNPPALGPKAQAFYQDFAYTKYNDYITYPDPEKNTIFYPFRDIMGNDNRIISQRVLSYPQGKEIQPNIFQEKTVNECDPYSKINPESEKNIIEENSEKFIRYSSFSGSFCDRYSFQNLLRNQGYLISITSRNIQGLPLRLCLVNYISGNCEFSTQVSASPVFKEDTFLLPPSGDGVGFDVYFNNFAITKSPSINDIKSIRVTPFPYTQLSQIEEYNTKSDSKNVDVIAFSQSFDKGWKAYEVKNTNWLNTTLPFLFGNELKEHVLVNNWTNGWVLDDQRPMTEDSPLGEASKRLVIIFWPQYLEYLGLVVLIGTFTWLLLTTGGKTKIRH